MTRPSNSSIPRLRVARIVALTLFASTVAFQDRHSRADGPPQIRLAAANAPAAANDAFQVTIEVSEVFEASNKQLQDRHLVLFKEGKAYDFALTEPRDVTVVDPIRGQVVLLSRENHVKSTISNQDVVTAAAKFRLFAINEGLQERLGISAKTEKIAAIDNGYQISFGAYHYEAIAAAPSMPMQPARFAEFTDWVARVNLIRRLGTPPFARIELGRAIATDGLVPAGIRLQMKSDTQTRTLQSQYTIKNGLSQDGQKRLDEVAGMMTLYREVPLGAFPR